VSHISSVRRAELSRRLDVAAIAATPACIETLVSALL
jgi:hypothetical protein